MRRSCKRRVSKRAFTLLEMVMVIAIIVILASALLFGVSGYIQGTNNAKNDVDAQAQALEDNVHASEQQLADYGF